MITGKDIAQFLTDKLGSNFVGLYDASVQQTEKDRRMEESVKKDFKSFFNRINKVG